MAKWQANKRKWSFFGGFGFGNYMTVVNIGKSHEREVFLVVLKSLCFAVTN